MQLGALQDVYTHSGPYVTVHLDVSRNTEDATQQLDARWTRARHQLEHDGVTRLRAGQTKGGGVAAVLRWDD